MAQGYFSSSKKQPNIKFKVNAGIMEDQQDTGKHEFWHGVADIVIGTGVHVLNAPPIAALAQLVSTPGLSVECVAAQLLSPLSAYGVHSCGMRNQGFHPWING